MDDIFARIERETTSFSLGDEETWRELYEPFHNGRPKNVQVTKDRRYGPASRNLLDVYAPTNSPDRQRPVLVFLHGGGFFSGDKSWSRNYWGNIGYYYASHGIVTVIINHQLVFYEGYKNDNSDVSESSSASYPAGADDVQLAREWVFENIGSAAFGYGCPRKVVLFGHSSGGAHIAMNLYASGDPERRGSQRPEFPPVAGVIYLSVPFYYDAARPVRKKILQKYYGSDKEDVWGPRTALGLFKRLPDDSAILDAMTIPTYIGTVKWEVKEAFDAAIMFFTTYRERSRPAGTNAIFHVLDRHNHLSNVLSIGTEDTAQATALLHFIKSCTDSPRPQSASKSYLAEDLL